MRNKIAFLIAGDILLSVVAIYAGSFVRFERVAALPLLIEYEGFKILFFIVVVTLVSYFVELYDPNNNTCMKAILSRVAIGVVVSFVILSSFYYLMPFLMFGRGVFAVSLCLFGILQFWGHTGYKLLLNLPGIATRVLVVGTGPLAKQIGKLILTTNHYHVLSGYVDCTSEQVYVPMDSVVSNGKELEETVKREKADKIVVSLSERRGLIPLKDLLNCKLSGIEVVDAPSFYEQLTGKLLLENITPGWLIFSEGFRITSLLRAGKRIIDLILSTIGLVVVLPLIPVIAIVIRLDSPGPVFFRQVRVGEREKNFTLYKFRSMGQDAESKTGAVWAQKDDSRVTKVGKFLRKSRLDEIPQLYNVFKGDMSFVGPRPERPEFVEKLKDIIPYYSERHFVKPGITGWAQVKYSYGSTVEDAIEKLRYDLYYIKNLSLFLDLLIVVDTTKVVLFGRGAR